MKRFEECLAMRLRIDREQLIVNARRCRILARGQIVERWILDHEVALAHRALDIRHRMTGRAPEAGLRLGCVDLFLDRPVEPSVEEHRVVVTARAPFRRLRPTTSCMYSIDLRYHWLLNDEKRWADDCHCW